MAIRRLARSIGRTPQVDQLTKQAAEMALRLAALPEDGLCSDRDLDQLEQLAMRILIDVAAVRAAGNPHAGDVTGTWPAVRRQ